MPTAILSVHDKTGLIEFAQALASLGWTLLASGGTAKLLRENGLSRHRSCGLHQVPRNPWWTCQDSPPRHPRRTPRPPHGMPIINNSSTSAGITLTSSPSTSIRLKRPSPKPNVTYADAIENIDIGGVTLIRAAAKNHERVTLVCDPSDYKSVLEEIRSGGISDRTRAKLAIKGFASTAHYDTAIHAYLKKQAE